MSTTLEGALEWAAAGIPVFPCKPDKSPYTSAGFKDASTHEQTIRWWWKRWPDALIGMPTGAASGISILDLDVKKGKNGLQAIPDWETLSPVIAETVNGGKHLYFRHDGTVTNSVDNFALGVDTRGTGGYAIVPPSLGYSFKGGKGLPDLAALPLWPERFRLPPRSDGKAAGGGDTPNLKLVARAIAAIPNPDELGWEDWNKVGMALWSATSGRDTGFMLFDAWSQKSAKYDSTTTRAKWDQITKSPPTEIGVGTLFHMAGQVDPHWRGGSESGSAPKLCASPYEWADPSTIPRRRWLYRPYYIRGFMSLTLAMGATAKSTLALTEAIAMATDRSLLGHRPLDGARPLNEELGTRPLRVWYINLEDPMDELQRRVGAICKQYGIKAAHLEGRLFINSGRDTPLSIAEENKGIARVNKEVVAQLIAEVREKQIDVVMVDPFVASHLLPENDNSKMNLVVRTWSEIAEAGNCAIMIVHHLRKIGRGEAGTVDDGRGASALLAAARSARVLNRMTKEEAQAAEISEEQRRFYIRADLGKANLSAPAEVATWYKLESVDLENVGAFGPDPAVDFDQGDKVGVVVPFNYPKAGPLRVPDEAIKAILARIRDGRWRKNEQATKEPWVGVAVADVLHLDVQNRAERRRVKALLGDWFAAGILAEALKPDDHRERRLYVVLGPNAAAHTGAARAAAE